MSEEGGSLCKEDHNRLLSSDDLFRLGNQHPLGLSFFRHLQDMGVTEKESASMLGSQTHLSEGFSEAGSQGVDTNFAKGTNGYGTMTKASEEGITLTWRDLSVYVPHKRQWQPWTKKSSGSYRPFKRVLNNVSGAVQPGSLVALMGSSGAGKSTLMNALAHRTPGDVVVDGDILVNGYRSSSQMSSLAGYVYQDDLFVGSLTCKEHLTFMARMRMDNKTSNAERATRVQELLKELGLTKAQNTRIGVPGMDKSLSGGERKRLAFATEILTDPSLLFCDEPTTGLDSFNARKLVKMMREMAARGKTVVCTIHQPSSEVFAMFDRLLLLAEGRIAYMGSSQGALEFFESLGHKCPSTFNPADFYIHTLAVLPGHEARSRDRIKRICDNYAVTPYAKDLDVVIQHQNNIVDAQSDYHLMAEHFDKNTPEKPGWGVQFYWLAWRSLTDSYRNPSIHSIRVVQKMVIGIMIGICYTHVQINQAGIQDIEGALFVFITENTFPSIFGVLNIFPQELPLFLREYKNGCYRSDAYYLSKMVSLVPGFIVDPVVFCVICYFMVGLQKHLYHFLMTVLFTVLTAQVSSALGAMFSAVFETVSLCMLFLIPIDVILLISGGLFINIATIPWFISWVRYLSWFLYSNEALTVIQWDGVNNITCEVAPDIPCITSGDDVITNFSFRKEHLTFDFAFLITLYCCFHLIGFLGLFRRARKK